MPSTTQRSSPQREITAGLQSVPNTPTDVTTTDSVIFQITVANTTGGAVTFTVTDKATSPKTLLPTVSIAANTAYVAVFPSGVWMTGGISWSASAASSLTAEIYGTYKG